MLSTSLHGARRQTPELMVGLRPALLGEPHGVQQVLRHTVGQLVDAVPLVSLLDDPVPQTVDTVLDFFRALDQPVDEQVIAVPKISFDRVSQRLVERRLPQIAEQLVEVPTVLSPTRIALQIAEQIVGISVPHGSGERHVHGFLPGQSSTLFPSAERTSDQIVERIVDIPGGGLHAVQGFLSRTWFNNVFHLQYAFLSGLWSKSSIFLVEVFLVSLPDRVQQRFVVQNMSTFQFLTVVESWVMVFFRPHQLGLLMRALLLVAVVWARHFLLVKMPLAVLLLAARLVLLVTMPLVIFLLVAWLVLIVIMCSVFWLLAARKFSSSTASSSLILAASGSPKGMASPSWSSIPRGAQFFEFWQNDQIWYDDDIHRVGSDVLVLKPVGRSGRAWSWMDPYFVGGPSEYRHAVRFSSPELARRVLCCVDGFGVRGLASPHSIMVAFFCPCIWQSHVRCCCLRSVCVGVPG